MAEKAEKSKLLNRSDGANSEATSASIIITDTEIADIFDRFDIDRSGRVNRSELAGALLRSTGVFLSDGDFAALERKFDKVISTWFKSSS